MHRIRRIWILLIISVICISGFGQVTVDTLKTVSEIVDSLNKVGAIYNPVQDKPSSIEFTTEQAVEFLKRQSQPRFWYNVNDPLLKAIEYLMFLATRPPYDSSEAFLKNYKYDSIKVPWEKFYVWDTLKFKIPDTEPISFGMVDSARFETDTINVAAESDSATVFSNEHYDIFSENARLKDTSILVLTDTLRRVITSDPYIPFRYYNNPYQVDSLETAINLLIKYLEDRDSTIINFAGMSDAVVPIWLNSKSNNMTRYWLKNEFNDSVTVWIGNVERNTIGLFLEQGVNFRRTMRATVGNTEARVNVERQDRSRLLELQRLDVKKKLWKYRTETNLAFNQTGLFNWVKGGEGSLSSLLDITGYADFNDKDKKFSSNNFVRLKLGFISSGDNPIRKNTDIFESSTKVNHKAFGKFDFSAVMLFKTQLLKGYNYPNDSIPVSKILNPAMLTLGFGLDYKPNEKTSINFSPLSYKLTFVLDTANIDQTKYGVSNNRKAKHEPGINFLMSNTMKPHENITVTNRLLLFTSYQKPQNIDVDWELTMTTKLNWFTELRINTHLIFSDNIKTPVLDKDKKPVLNPDGTEKKTARIQFKEIIGLSLAFVF